MSTTASGQAQAHTPVQESFEVREHPSTDRPLKDSLIERGQWDAEPTPVRPWGEEGVVYNPRA